MKSRFTPPLFVLLLAAFALPAQDKMTKDALVAKAIDVHGAEGYKLESLPGFNEDLDY